jgi:hypothetical protein
MHPLNCSANCASCIHPLLFDCDCRSTFSRIEMMPWCSFVALLRPWQENGSGWTSSGRHRRSSADHRLALWARLLCLATPCAFLSNLFCFDPVLSVHSRLDKFYSLVRKVFSQMFVYLQRHKWKKSSVKRYTRARGWGVVKVVVRILDIYGKEADDFMVSFLLIFVWLIRFSTVISKELVNQPAVIKFNGKFLCVISVQFRNLQGNFYASIMIEWISRSGRLKWLLYVCVS